MLNRTLLFSVITVAVSALLFFGTSSFVIAAEKGVFFHLDNTLILGQGPGDSRRGPTLADQFRRTINRIFQDDSPPDHSNQHSQRQTTQGNVPPAVPVQPPRPLTTAETQQAIDAGGPTQQRGVAGIANAPSQRVGSMFPGNRDITNEGGEDELTIQARMHKMRDTIFSSGDVERAAHETRQVRRATPSTPASLTPAPIFRDAGNNRSNSTGDLRGLASIPAASNNSAALPAMTPAVTETVPEIFVPIHITNPLVGSHNNQIAPAQTLPNQVGSSFPTQQPIQQPVQPFATIEPQRRESSKQLVVTASPQLTFEIEQPPSAVVGQEIVCRVRATNAGNVPAERVVLNVEIPPWIEIRHTDTDNGNCVLLPRNDGSRVVDVEWRVNRINQGETNLLALWMVPQLSRAIELPIQYHFHRQPIAVKVEIQEPKLVMELIGPDEVRWNDPTTYTLVVRNIGTGSAEKLRFELSQTSAENAATSMEEPLLPGEGQEIPIQVKAGREQEQIDIAVVATGAHNLKNEVKRRIRVLRPKLEMSVQTSPIHFVDEPAEMVIRVVNNGNADADNVTIRAELPLGAAHVTSSEGGLFVQQQQQNIVEWRGRSVGKGEIQTFSLVCTPRREGECRISAAASEVNGSLLAAGHGTFTAEAIVELDLNVHRPKGSIELGQETTYTIEVTNLGTKAAEEVEISMMFGEQLEPIAVSGLEAYYTTNGQVFFEKIPAILPKQCVTLKVSVEAKGIGTAQIKAEVVRIDANGTSVRLEQGVSAHIFSRKPQRGAAVAEQTAHNEVFR